MTSSLTRSRQTEKGLAEAFCWERLALASGILFVAVELATVAFNIAFFATTHPPMDASPQETARGFARAETMVEIGTYLYVLHLPFLLLFLGGLFGVLLRAEGGIAPRWIGWAGLALGMISLISTGTLIALALFPFLALRTLLFVVWIAALTVALLRSTRMESLIMPPADEASRVPVETDGM